MEKQMQDDQITSTAENYKQIVEEYKRRIDNLQSENKRLKKKCSSLETSLKHTVKESELNYRRQQEELEYQKQIFETMLKTLPAGVWIVDEKGVITGANDEARKIWGGYKQVGPEKYKIYKAWNYDTGDEISTEQRATTRAISQGESTFQERVKIETFDDKVKVLINSVVPIRDENNNIKGAIAVQQDISELTNVSETLYKNKQELASERELLQRMVQDLRKTKERFEILAQTANELLKSTELQSSVQNICHNIMEYLNCQVFFNYITIDDNKLFLNAYEGIPQEEAEKIRYLDFGSAICGCVARDGECIKAEHIQTSEDQRANLVRSFGVKAYVSYPLLSKGGKVIGTLSFGTKERDIFSQDDLSMINAVADQVAIAMIRMNNQNVIKDNEERFSTAFKSNPSALVLSRLEDGTIQEVNDSFIKLVGWSRDEVIGKSSVSLNIFRDQNERNKNANLLREQKQVNNQEIKINTKTNEERIVLLSSNLLKMSQGDMILTSMQDRTEQRIVEQKLHDTLNELERSNKELEQFAYITSHDLQEPLRMLANFSKLLSNAYKGKLDSRADEYLHFIIDGAKRMQNLISDLLTYARVTARPAPFAQTDLNAIMDEVQRDLQLIISESGTQIFYEQLPVINADPIQIKQLFQNLIQNAIKFRGESEPRIQITHELKDNKWHFSVSDNGIGIKPQFYERIFVIFQRLHEKERYPGTGIGLSICRKIVERHGGSIWVESEEGKGSTFHFTIQKYIS
ncbi:MAG: ATP-binding protein [Bacteroidota bacterium]|nr:ATP-binding protein [Bacteroidota bacterium]